MSWLELASRWRRGRLAPSLFLPLALAIAGGALLLRLLAGFYGAPWWLDWPFLTGLAFLVLAQLRLLDDLADRDYDRVRHPQRLLAQQVGLKPFYAALALLTFASLALAVGLVSPRAAAGLLGLDAGMLAIYAASRLGRWPRLLHAHAVLLKYPGCVYCLAGMPALGRSGGLLLAGIFLVAGICELSHDRELRSSRGGGVLLLGELAVLGTLCLWPLLRPLEASP